MARIRLPSPPRISRIRPARAAPRRGRDGSPHVTLRPDDAVGGPFDAVCLGEGEEAVVELADSLERGERPSDIRNFWFENGGAVERNPTRPFHQELDELPFPSRHLWRRWIEEPPKHTILIARGCPFTCTYCSNHALWKVASGKYVRFRSTENVIAELEELCEQFPEITYCYFEVAGRDRPLLERVDSIVWQTIRGYPRVERLAQRLRGRGILTRLRRTAGAVRGLAQPRGGRSAEPREEAEAPLAR